MCIAQGFPSIPFFVDEDLTRSDGVIVCRSITAADTVRLSWKLLRVLKLLTRIPIEF